MLMDSSTRLILAPIGAFTYLRGKTCAEMAHGLPPAQQGREFEAEVQVLMD